jgi:hypothetical protein
LKISKKSKEAGILYRKPASYNYSVDYVKLCCTVRRWFAQGFKETEKAC